MKKLVYFILFLSLPAADLFSRSDALFPGVDTLFGPEEFMYYSELERGAFGDFLNGKPDYLTMTAAVNPSTDSRELGLYRDWIEEIITEISRKKFRQMDPARKIDHIKKYVGNSLLVNYKREADFYELFSSGYYNYFTASACYALILDGLGIPYKIYEAPTHLYIIAYPDTEKIRFESARPGHPFFMFDHETRREFVEHLHVTGTIDPMSYSKQSERELFRQYFFSDRGLSIREMTGMLYINSAVNLMMAGRTRDSYSQLEKAFIMYPSYKTQYMLLVQLNRYLISMDYRNPLDLGYLIKASRLINYGVDFEVIDGYLRDIVTRLLVKEEDQEAFEYTYDYLLQYIRNEELKVNFRFYYLYESGRMEFNAGRYMKSLEYLEAAHQMRPEDEKARDLLTRALGGFSLASSPTRVLQKIENYDTAFTEITGRGIYLMVKIQTYLSLFGEAFQLRDGENGEMYMAEFEKLMEENPDAEPDHILIGRSYSSAAIYYYKTGRVSRSEQVLKKGLSYAPDNIELKLKLSSFK